MNSKDLVIGSASLLGVLFTLAFFNALVVFGRGGGGETKTGLNPTQPGSLPGASNIGYPPGVGVFASFQKRSLAGDIPRDFDSSLGRDTKKIVPISAEKTKNVEADPMANMLDNLKKADSIQKSSVLAALSVYTQQQQRESNQYLTEETKDAPQKEVHDDQMDSPESSNTENTNVEERDASVVPSKEKSVSTEIATDVREERVGNVVSETKKASIVKEASLIGFVVVVLLPLGLVLFSVVTTLVMMAHGGKQFISITPWNRHNFKPPKDIESGPDVKGPPSFSREQKVTVETKSYPHYRRNRRLNNISYNGKDRTTGAIISNAVERGMVNVFESSESESGSSQQRDSRKKRSERRRKRPKDAHILPTRPMLKAGNRDSSTDKKFQRMKKGEAMNQTRSSSGNKRKSSRWLKKCTSSSSSIGDQFMIKSHFIAPLEGPIMGYNTGEEEEEEEEELEAGARSLRRKEDAHVSARAHILLTKEKRSNLKSEYWLLEKHIKRNVDEYKECKISLSHDRDHPLARKRRNFVRGFKNAQYRLLECARQLDTICKLLDEKTKKRDSTYVSGSWEKRAKSYVDTSHP